MLMDQESRVVNWSSLPEDLWYDILTWASFPSLNSCRRINNTEWRRITNESNFVALHLERTKTVSGYFVQYLVRNVYSSAFIPFKPLPPSIPTPSLKFLPEGTKILSSSQLGILCCESPQTHKYGLPHRYCVCNPTTQQCRWIPSPKNRFHTEQVTVVASHADGKLNYKIVRLSANFGNRDFTVCEIFDSKTWRWRRYGGLKLPYLMLHNEPGVELDNVVYWIEWNKPYIFAFDVNREVWKEMALPEWREEEERVWKTDKLVVVCGELCLARDINRDGLFGEHYIEIWKMIEEGKWQKIQHERETLSGLGPVCDFYTSQVWFLTGMWENIWMDLGKREITKVAARQLCATEVFKYESTRTEIYSFDTRMD